MADGVSPLRDCLAARPSRGSGGAGVKLTEVGQFTLMQFAAWPANVAEVATMAARAIGVREAPGPGQAVIGKGGALVRIEPLKWWLIRQGEPRALPSLTGDAGAVLDLSHSRTWIRLDGPKASVLLNRFLPIDLGETAFPHGAACSSAFHHVGVTLWRAPSGFNLFVPRSFAVSLWQLLAASAEQHGLEVE